MTNDELKKKILTIVRGAMLEADELPFIETTDNIADALIAAGIGDLKEHRIFAGKDGSIKQLYSGEEVEKIVKERKELKDELRSTVEYIQEQDEVIKEYKHRAQVAGRIAKMACDIVFSQEINDEEWDEAIFNYKKESGIREIGVTPNILYDYLKEQAEKELAEEGDDDSRGNDEGE